MKKNPILKLATLPASAKQIISPKSVANTRTLSVHARCTYNGDGTGALRLNIFLSPDGDNWDTVAYTYFDVTVTAGSAVQKSQLILSPEEGYMVFEVENLDAVYAITNIFVWTTVKPWDNKES